MPLYVYSALDTMGCELSGEIDALSSSEAISMLRGQGLYPTKVRLGAGQVEGPAAVQESMQAKAKPKRKVVKRRGKGSFLFDKGSGKCKLTRGGRAGRGEINLWGEEGEVSFVFESKLSAMGAEEKVSINVKDIARVEVGGVIRKRLVVKTKNGQEFEFVGKVARVGGVLKYEVKTFK